MNFKKWGKWAVDNSLWLAALGLMLASSGLDGSYMARMMEWGWLGYVLNTTADLAGMLIIYHFGRFRQSPRGSKKYKLALLLLPAEGVAVAYSWLFSWRQLLIVLPPVEGADTWWMAKLAAGFIPLLLMFIGFAQSIAAGRVNAATEDTVAVAKRRIQKEADGLIKQEKQKTAEIRALLKKAQLAAERTEAETHAEVVAKIKEEYPTAKEQVVRIHEMELFTTQKEIGEALDLSSSCVSRYLKGVDNG
jgi:hypothetical protein